LTYIDRVIERGLHPDDFVPQFVFFFSVSLDFFEEVAKFRAFRRLWAKLMKERYGVKKPESMQAKLHVYTGGSNLTAQQPLNNIVRVTCEALGAVLSGVQYLFLSSMDEALQTPSEEAVMVAIRTQQIIANELNVTSTVDPLAGSYYVESLTFKIEEEVLSYLKKIEGMGGSIPAIESGFFQSEIAREGFRYQEELEKKERIKVGVNEYMVKGKAKIPPLRQDEEGEQKTVANIKKLKSERDNSKVKVTLDALRRAAEREENLIIPTMEAVKAYATLGEICDVYRAVYGTFKEELAIY
jgi:methylmalonyl-CoA mutase N-terminal domain/subunit